MKRITIPFLLVLSASISSFAQVGIGTNSPDSSALLDITSKYKGFLPPRVALAGTNISDPVKKPSSGLLVFNTSTAGNEPFRVFPGYYFWNGSAWNSLVNGGKAGDMLFWNGSH